MTNNKGKGVKKVNKDDKGSKMRQVPHANNLPMNFSAVKLDKVVLGRRMMGLRVEVS